jgi:hypothetical protein
MITLTEEERAILNHVVEDADDWASRPIVTREHVDAKVAKHKQSYLDAQGDGYKTRKQREDAFAKEEQEQHDNVAYDVKRKREFPSALELVVALYDTDDKADIDRRRAEVKAKYPKP